jgi:hypothetical protein
MARVTAQVAGGTRKDGEARTIAELKAKLNADGYTAVVNGENEDDSYELRDGDFVALSQPLKAG